MSNDSTAVEARMTGAMLSRFSFSELVQLAGAAPGVVTQVFGCLMVLVALEVRFEFVTDSRTLAGSEFAAVFLSGTLLIILGAIIRLAKQRMSADEALQARRLEVELRLAGGVAIGNRPLSTSVCGAAEEAGGG